MSGLSLGSAVSCCMAGDFLYGRRRLFINYARPAILCGNEAWCPKEGQLTERSLVTATCEVQLKDRKRAMVLMMMILILNGTIVQLAIANSVHCCVHVLKKEDDHVLRTLDIEGLRKNGSPKMTWKKPVEEECMKVGSTESMHFVDQSGLMVLI